VYAHYSSIEKEQVPLYYKREKRNLNKSESYRSLPSVPRSYSAQKYNNISGGGATAPANNYRVINNKPYIF